MKFKLPVITKPKLCILGAVVLSLVLTTSACLYTFNSTVSAVEESQVKVLEDVQKQLDAERQYVDNSLKLELAQLRTEQKLTNDLLYKIIKIATPGDSANLPTSRPVYVNSGNRTITTDNSSEVFTTTTNILYESAPKTK